MESKKRGKVNNKKSSYPQSIFIVGMPRSGSTLLESILSINKNVDDLGETNILEESFLSWKNPRQKLGLEELYLKKTKEIKKNKSSWVPYFKNAARSKYFYEPVFSIEKNYKKYHKKIPNYLIRNEKFFFKEGISCSSVGIRFSAAYMPEGCLFGVNANFFFKNDLIWH